MLFRSEIEVAVSNSLFIFNRQLSRTADLYNRTISHPIGQVKSYYCGSTNSYITFCEPQDIDT